MSYPNSVAAKSIVQFSKELDHIEICTKEKGKGIKTFFTTLIHAKMKK